MMWELDVLILVMVGICNVHASLWNCEIW